MCLLNKLTHLFRRLSNYRDGCTYYNYNYTRVANLSYENAVEELKDNIYKPDIVKCDNYTIRRESNERTSFANTVMHIYYCFGNYYFEILAGT